MNGILLGCLIALCVLVLVGVILYIRWFGPRRGVATTREDVVLPQVSEKSVSDVKSLKFSHV
jgi:hypothetical protein